MREKSFKKSRAGGIDHDIVIDADPLLTQSYLVGKHLIRGVNSNLYRVTGYVTVYKE